jgi:tetratricopeptide (TPR) repeat protein
VENSSFQRAQQAFHLAEREPEPARAIAARILAQARSAGDFATCSVAERAIAAAALHLSDLDVSIRHARSAVRYGQRAGSRELAAQARMTLAFATGSRGRHERALREADTALADLRGAERTRGLAQRGVILHQFGRLDDALAAYNKALPRLRKADDGMWVWRVLSNRAILHGHRFELSTALADLLEASRIADRLDMGMSAAYTLENLGWVHTLRGDLPRALSYLQQAERRLRAQRAQLGEVLRDRSELLLSMYLVTEARDVAAQAVRELEQDRRFAVVPEVRLLLARAALLSDDPAVALDQARRAAREFQQAGRPEWAAAARHSALAARLAGPDRARVTPSDAARVADDLEATPWVPAALDARITAGTVALDRGRVADALEHLRLASRSTGRGPAALRARAWYATALLRNATGNRAGAQRALRVGLRTVDEYRATFGATDLRARAAAHRTDLVRLGLRMAIAETGGRAATRVFEWAEREHAGLSLLQPVRPPEDPVLAAALSQLRAAVTEVAEQRRAGRDPARALGRQIALETHVRDHCRQQIGAGTVAEPVSIEALRDRLGPAVLVEFVEIDERLFAVSVDDRRLLLHRLGASREVRHLLDRAVFALHQLTRARRRFGAPPSAPMSVLTDAAVRLDDLLLRPVVRLTGDTPVVLIPTGPLQSLPWSVLPSCRGRPVTVAPSATDWHRASTRDPVSTGSVAVIAGPDLPGGRIEADAIGRTYGVSALTGTQATVAAASEALSRADLAHLAVHGSLSQDNPLFSALRLADGPLMVYDVERLPRVPPTVVLAACDSGRHIVWAGGELLGVSAAFLGRGTRQLIASVIAIPDVETVPLMLAFHRRLVGGATPAAALAEAQQVLGGSDSPEVAAAAGFVCIGAGLAPLTMRVGAPDRAGAPAGAMII